MSVGILESSSMKADIKQPETKYAVIMWRDKAAAYDGDLLAEFAYQEDAKDYMRRIKGRGY